MTPEIPRIAFETWKLWPYGIALAMFGIIISWLLVYYYLRWRAWNEPEKEPTSVLVEVPSGPFCRYNYHCSFKDYGDDEDSG